MFPLFCHSLVLFCGLALATGALGQAGPSASGRDYPARPVKLVAPFTAGSQTDLLARVMGSQFQEMLGQPFIVENRVGAQGSIAAEVVANSAPDGYTLLLSTNSPLATNVSVFKKLPYDPMKDFSHIARIGVTMFVLMVRPDFPAKTIDELIRSAKSKLHKLSGGFGGGGGQVSLALLKSMANVDVIDVSYKGVPQAVSDVLGGSISFAFVDLGNAIALANSGKLRALGVTSEKRTALAPDMPAIAETVPGYNLIAWMGLVAPAATPPEILAKLQEITIRILSKPDVKARLASLGIDVAPMGAAEFSRFIESEIAKWAILAKLANLHPE